MDVVKNELRKFGFLFFAVDRNSTTFESSEDVPNYVAMVTPHFFGLVGLELLILHFKNSKVRINDVMNSISHWMLFSAMSTCVRGVELVGYHWVYERRLIDLDWHHPSTWWIAAFGIDFGYYWVHRFVHEVAFGWAVHQVHHSSEEYTLTAGIRQSMFQKCCTFIFYYPLAFLGVPVSALLVHLQLNALYQFWLHTELVTNLGPLEWVLNTPAHHRVHHGSDPWCLDKNYGGILIIWDRLFGTYEPSRKDVKITFGVIYQPETLNVFYLQFFYLKMVFEKAFTMDTVGDFLKSIFYPPAWERGEAWTYEPPYESEFAPHREKYDPKLPRYLELYAVGHFLATLIIQQKFLTDFHENSWLSVMLHMIYFLVTLGNIGALYDGWKGAFVVEAMRCGTFFAFALYWPLFDSGLTNTVLLGYSALSVLVWFNQAVLAITLGFKVKGESERKQE